MDKQCQHIKENGEKCGSFAVGDSVFCFNHEPGMKDAKLKAVQKGGASESYRKLNLKLAPLVLHSSSDVVGAIIQTINELRAGEIPPKVASTIGYLLGIALKAYEQADLTNRVGIIERVILERSTK